MAAENDNPYAPSQQVGPAPPSSVGKVIAMACLVLATIFSLPVAFFASCLGGVLVSNSIVGNRGGAGDFVGWSGMVCGFIGVGLTIWGAIKLIMIVSRSGQPRPAYNVPKEFPNSSPFPPQGENPFAPRGDNPFSN